VLAGGSWDRQLLSYRRSEGQLTCKWHAMPTLSHLTCSGSELEKGAIGGCGHGEESSKLLGQV
jgi:hypothetical protein